MSLRLFQHMVTSALAALVVSGCGQSREPALRPDGQPLERLVSAEARAKVRAVDAQMNTASVDQVAGVCQQAMRIIEQSNLVVKQSETQVSLRRDVWGRVPEPAQKLLRNCLADTGNPKVRRMVAILDE